LTTHLRSVTRRRAAAAANYLDVPSGTRAQTPNQAGLAFGTGTIDVRCEVAPDVWATGNKTPTLLDQSNKFYFVILADGRLEFFLLHAGAVSSFAQSTVATGFGNGVRKWVRAVRDIAAGTCDFYTSPDGSTWTALGTQVTGLNTTTEYALGSTPLSVGWGGNPSDQFVGKVYTTRILVNSATVINMDWTTATPGTGPWVATTGETWTRLGTASVIAG
jgi:hypothetical protein